jgi:hypothetical protein
LWVGPLEDFALAGRSGDVEPEDLELFIQQPLGGFLRHLMGFLMGFNRDIPSNNGDEMGYTLLISMISHNIIIIFILWISII